VRSLGLSLLLLLALPALALGHADLSQSEPAPGGRVSASPEQLRLVFAAPIEEAGLAVSVLGPGGEELVQSVVRAAEDPTAAAIALSPASTVGVYQVRWRTFSQDGRVTHGLQRYSVGSSAPSGVDMDVGNGAVAIGARALAIAGPVLLLGLLVLRIGVARAPSQERAGRLWWRAWILGTGLWAIGLAFITIETVGAFDADPFGGFSTASDPTLSELLTETRWGVALLVQVTTLAVAWLTERLARPIPAGEWADRAWLWVLAAPPTIALLSISWASHASSGNDAAVSIGVDAIHNVATGVWLGGLAGLLALVLLPARRLAEPTRIATVAPVIVRFSAVAVAAVTVLVVTGLYRALVELDTVQDLFDTGYGQALAVKLGVFALLLGVGAYNRFVAHPRLERAEMGLADSDKGAAAILVHTVRAELALSAVLLVVVGVLVSLPPPG
jgi:copper transport protein